MANTREKLIDLIYDALNSLSWNWGDYPDVEATTDYLIANGVTVQKWIPVTERLPKNGEAILTCYWDGWICDQYSPVDDGVTHWMPLPEPPKGE